MHAAVPNRRRVAGFVFCAMLVTGCSRVSPAASGDDGEVIPPVLTQSSADSRGPHHDASFWDDYPSDATAFLAYMLPVVAVATEPYFLNDLACDDLRLTRTSEQFKGGLPETLGRQAIEANLGFVPLPKDDDLVGAIEREKFAHGRHCDDVLAAYVRYRAAVSSIPMNASEAQVRLSVDAAYSGRQALVSQSFNIYLGEMSQLSQGLRSISCRLQSRFPEESVAFLEALRDNWTTEITRAFQLRNLTMLESSGFPPPEPAEVLTGRWIQRKWKSDDNFPSWLCPG